ncbi:hypothetical protein CL630_01415 [bacterium]|nr:hypothetical protein [bacterium]|tara:strand:+ start:24132 stop:24485 length:354 start_codon:yes stop_codon:yes gene_type:complete
MSFTDFLFRTKEPIRPELIVAFNSKIPDSIDVRIQSSKDGGYVAEIGNIDNCITQANSGKEIIEMVNDAMHTSLGIPEDYRKFVTHYQPSQELVEKFGMTIPNEYLDRNFVMEKIVA